MIANDMLFRWNSTYLMLQSVIPLSTCFTFWYNGNRRDNLLNEQYWDDLRLICTFLQVFYEAATVLSSSLRATTPLILHHLIIISNVLKTYKGHQRLAWAVKSMQEKLLKYFYLSPYLYAFALLLDPCCRILGLKKFLKLLTK